jgi:hypothetical protein
MSYPPCRYARRWPELWAQQRSDADRWRLSHSLASGRLDGQEPSRAFVAAFIDPGTHHRAVRRSMLPRHRYALTCPRNQW